VIIVGRHLRSADNAGLWEGPTSPDVPIVDEGRPIGYGLGHRLAEFLRRASILESPFLRARQSMDCILEAAGLTSAEGERLVVCQQNPRLGELDFGPAGWTASLDGLGGIYRHVFSSGKCFAVDGYAQMEPLVIDLQDAYRRGAVDVFIMTHGWMALILVMIWFGLNEDVYDRLANLENGGIIKIGFLSELDEAPVFQSGEWGVTGIRFRTST